MRLAIAKNGWKWCLAAVVLAAGAGGGRLMGQELIPAGKPVTETNATTLGRTAPDFELQDTAGKTHRLADYADSKAVVLVFLGAECPLVRLYAPRIQQLADDYAQRGVQVIGIDANVQDTPQDLAAFAKEHHVEIPLLLDAEAKVADALGAKRTPEAFVLDAKWVVRYHGPIDDQFEVGVQRASVGRRDLAAALDELLDGRPVSRPELAVSGCLIGRARPTDAKSDVTWSGQIAATFGKHCVECHQPGEIAPFSLTSYDDAAAWGETIVEAIQAGRMPPWFADPRHGHFANEIKLTADERKQIAEWVAAGCPEGDSGVVAAAAERADVTADETAAAGDQLVLPMSDTPFRVPADGVVDYQYYVVDPGWTEDQWVTNVEVRPGNRSVVHHILVFVVRPGAVYPPVYPGELIGGYVPGLRGIHYPAALAMRLPAGSKIVFQMHYTPNGVECEDTSSIALRLTNASEVTHEVKAEKAINVLFQIPPGAADYEAQSTYTFVKDAQLLSLIPHMHVRGKSFRYDAYYPDGTHETLLNVPRYDFNWQLEYILAEPKQIPAGTKLVCTAAFDNSAANPSNPDPESWVTFGEQTYEEMLIGFFVIAEERGSAPSNVAAIADRVDHVADLVEDLSVQKPWPRHIMRLAEEADRQIRYAQRRGRLSRSPLLQDVGHMIWSGVAEAEKQHVLNEGENPLDVNRGLPFLRRLGKALSATMNEQGADLGASDDEPEAPAP